MMRNGTSAHEAHRTSLWLQVAFGLLLTMAIGSCGTADDSTTSVENSTSISSPESTTDVETTVAVTDAANAEQLPSIDALWAMAQETIDLPRMSFELDVTLSMPGMDGPLLQRRTGSFDDDTFSGVGSRSFETEDAQSAKSLGDEPFGFRFVGETFWIYNPLGDPPGWEGFDLTEFADLVGGDPLGSVDGDLHLALVVEATREVLDVQSQPDGSSVWVLNVRADDLIHIVSAAGPASRLIGRGAAESGLDAEVRLMRNADGYVVGFVSDLSEWWTHAINLVTDAGKDQHSMTVEFRLETFDNPLTPNAPCENPSTVTEDSGMLVLVCGT